MTFTIPIFNHSFTPKEGQFAILVIENKEFYQNFIKDIILQINGYEGESVFYIKDKEINFSKSVELVSDVFSLNINATKNITKLHSVVKNEIYQNIGEKAISINSKIYNLLEEIYKFLEYSKINMLFVETIAPQDILPQEIYRIIDKDLCIIY